MTVPHNNSHGKRHGNRSGNKSGTKFADRSGNEHGNNHGDDSLGGHDDKPAASAPYRPVAAFLPRHSSAWRRAAEGRVAALARLPVLLLLLAGHAAHAVDAPLQGPAAAVATPRRIISLMPSLTETVCAVGACDRLVGVDRHSDSPARVLRLPKVGGMEDASVESIVALRPDVVLARSNSRVVPRLQALGVRVMVFDIKTHADMRRVMEQVAVLTGRPGAGEEAWQVVDRQIGFAFARMPRSWREARVYVEVHGGAAGASEASFIGETLTRLGLRNVVPGEMGPFPRLSSEYVVRQRPDLIVTSALNNLGVTSQRPGWAMLDAVRLGRQCSFSTERYAMLMRPGPRLGEAADALVDCLRGLGDRG